MTKRRWGGNKKLIIGGAIAGAILLVIIIAVIVNGSGQKKTDPYITNSPSNQNSGSTTNDSASNNSPTTNTSDTSKQPDTPDSTVDPQKVATIDITQLGITVSYVKGVGGFQYQVLRTPNGTQYVEFSSTDLVGTKCTDDNGAFASILVNPGNTESSTLTKTVKVDGDTYGLSLADGTCTSNSDKLKAYQQSFSDAFSLLKKTS